MAWSLSTRGSGRFLSGRPRTPVAWRRCCEGHRAQVEHERGQWANNSARTVFAAGVLGLPGDDGSLRFRFYAGYPNYKRLVSTPGLGATVVVDRASSQIMSVRFHAR